MKAGYARDQHYLVRWLILLLPLLGAVGAQQQQQQQQTLL